MYQNSYAVFSATTSDFKQQKYIITNHVCINLLRLQVRLGSAIKSMEKSKYFFRTFKWICSYTTKTIPKLSPQFTPLQQQNNLQPRSTKSGLEQLPTQLNAQCNCLPPFQPYQPLQSEQDSLVPPFSPSLVSSSGIWSRCRVEKRKVGGATGPQVGERVIAQPMLDDGGEGFWWLRYYSNSNLFPVVGFLRIKIHVASARICQMSNVPIRCSNKVFHTTKAHYHEACPYPLSNPPWLIRNQWSMVNTIFDTLKWNQMDLYNEHLIPTIYSHAAQKWAWTASHPTQRTVQLPSTVSTLPTSSVGAGFSGSSVFPSLVSSSGIWSRCRVEKRKVGGATGPQVGERVNAQPMLDDGGEGFCGCDAILILIFSL